MFEGTFDLVGFKPRFDVDTFVNSKCGKIYFTGVDAKSEFFDWFCGYVKLTDGHRWLDFVDENGSLDYFKINEDVYNNFSELCDLLEGGAVELTYADKNGWIGFDTNHIWDDAIGWTEEKLLENILIWARIVEAAA